MSEPFTPVMDVAAAQAAGVVTEVHVTQDFFGFTDETKHFLPDNVQYFVLQRMNEGQKSQYQREVRSDITIQRASGDAKMQPDPAKERHALIKACVVNWSVYTKGPDGKVFEPPFSLSGGKVNLEHWLKVADPRLVEDLETACRKLNPWLVAEMSVSEIDKAIEELKERREEAVVREQGE